MGYCSEGPEHPRAPLFDAVVSDRGVARGVLVGDALWYPCGEVGFPGKNKFGDRTIVIRSLIRDLQDSEPAEDKYCE